MRVLLFLPPVLQLILFGFAVNLDVENSRIGWMDLDRTPQSRQLLSAFQGSRSFVVAAAPGSQAEAQGLLDRGEVQAVVGVLPGFGKEILRGRTTAVQVLIDGTNSNTASLLASYCSQTVARYSAAVLEAQRNLRVLESGAQSPPARALPVVEPEPRVWFNPELRSRNYFVPGVVVNIIMLVTLTLTALAIVREKEIGTMEQLMVTPLRPVELILGKLLPFAGVGLLDLGLVTSAALLIFRIPFRGSALLLLGCALLFLLSSLGIGLFISTTSDTQQQAMMGTFFYAVPAFMLSGFAFPIRNMPAVVQYATYLNPMRYFMEIVRGIFLKGVGAEVLWPQMLGLAVFGTAVMSLATLRFRKRLD